MRNTYEWELNELTVKDIIDYRVNNSYLVDDCDWVKLKKFVRWYSVSSYDSNIDDYEQVPVYYNTLVYLVKEKLDDYKQKFNDAIFDDDKVVITHYEKKILSIHENMDLLKSLRSRVFNIEKKIK